MGRLFHGEMIIHGLRGVEIALVKKLRDREDYDEWPDS